MRLLAFAQQIAQIDLKPRMVQHEIDGLVYTSSKLPASIGLELAPRMAVLLGHGLMRAIVLGDADNVDEYTILAVAERAMKDGLTPLAKALMRTMQVSQLGQTKGPGSVLDGFDDHFAGEYEHLLKVCVFSLAHQFRGPTLGVR